MIDIPRSPIALRDEAPKGSWWLVPMWVHRSLPAEKITPAIGYTCIKCPDCGKVSTLRDANLMSVRADGSRGHDIQDDGVVKPSIVCPHPGCTWHVWGRLLDWKPA